MKKIYYFSLAKNLVLKISNADLRTLEKIIFTVLSIKEILLFLFNFP